MNGGGVLVCRVLSIFFFKQKTAYEMRISDWSSDVCSSDLLSTCTITARARDLLKRSSASTRAWLPWINPWILTRAMALSPGFSPVAGVSTKRSDERRVGQECVRTCRYRWLQDHSQQNNHHE